MSKKITHADIFIYSTPQGGYEVCAMVDGYRETRYYDGYTKRQAQQLFYNEINNS